MTFVIDHPRLTIVIAAILTVIFFTQLKKTHMETDIEAFLPQHHPAIIFDNMVEDIFGVKSDMMLTVVNRGPQGIYNSESLALLKRLTEKLEAMKGINSEDVDSLANLDNIIGTSEGMDVRPFMAEVPQTQEEIEALRAAVRGNSMYRGTIVSEDEKAAVVFARLEDGVEESEIYNKVKAMVAEEELGSNEVYFAGRPILEGLIGIQSKEDAKNFLVAMIVIVIILFLTFRSLRGVMLPLLVVVPSVFWAVGLMNIFSVPFYITSIMMPIILMAIGVADGIHILSKYYDEVIQYPDKERRAMVLDTMMEMWPPVVMTSVTTAAGFLAFTISTMPPFVFFGLFTAFGVMAAMLLSLTIIPAGLMLMKPKVSPLYIRRKGKIADLRSATFSSRVLAVCGRGVYNHRNAVLAIAVIVVVVSLVGIMRVSVDSSLVSYFKQDTDVVKAEKVLNEKFAGTTVLNVVFEGKEPDRMKDPALLRKIDKMQDYAETLPLVGDSLTISEYLKRMNRVMNEDREEMEVVPDSKELVAQYLLLYSMSGDPDDFDDVVDYDYQRANTRIFMKSDHAKDTGAVVRSMGKYLKENFKEKDINIGFAGRANITYTIAGIIVRNQVMSLILAIIAVFFITSGMFRSWMAGFLSVIPIGIATLVNFGLMGLLNNPLNPVTAINSSISIGIGIDYSIHYISKYRRMMAGLKDEREGNIMTIITAGKAIFYNAVVVAGGFLVLALSQFPPNATLGGLVSLSMMVSFVGALTVLAALLVTTKPRFAYSYTPESEK
jgi:hypothetical protein